MGDVIMGPVCWSADIKDGPRATSIDTTNQTYTTTTVEHVADTDATYITTVENIATTDPRYTTTGDNTATTDPSYTTTGDNTATTDPRYTTTGDNTVTTDPSYTTISEDDAFVAIPVKLEVTDADFFYDVRPENPDLEEINVVNAVNIGTTGPTDSAVTSDSGETVEELWDLFTRWCHSVGVQAPASVSEMRESICDKSCRPQIAAPVPVKREMPRNNAEILGRLDAFLRDVNQMGYDYTTNSTHATPIPHTASTDHTSSTLHTTTTSHTTPAACDGSEQVSGEGHQEAVSRGTGEVIPEVKRRERPRRRAARGVKGQGQEEGKHGAVCPAGSGVKGEGQLVQGVQCQICAKWFRDNFKLRQHCISHNPIDADTCERKHFECGECKVYFKLKSSYVKHVGNHVGSQGVKPRGDGMYIRVCRRGVVCPTCRKWYRDIRDLRAHRKTHNPIDAATGEKKKYACAKCKVFYARKNVYHTHLRTCRKERK